MSVNVAAANAQTPAGRSKGLEIGLWVVQVLLALGFGMAGFGKLTTPIAELAVKMTWVTTVPMGLVRFIGAAELLGAIGLILPAATRIKPGLTALAATGLVTIMVLAIPFHLMRGELFGPPINLTLGGLAAFVAWGRYKKAAIAPR